MAYQNLSTDGVIIRLHHPTLPECLVPWMWAALRRPAGGIKASLW